MTLPGDTPGRRLKRWLNPLLFGAWAAALIFLLAGGRYTAFLRPELGLLLGAALVIVIGFMVAAIARTRTAAVELSAVLRVLVLLVPLVYLIVLPGDAMLGSHVFKKRFVGAVSLPSEPHERLWPSLGEMPEGLGSPPVSDDRFGNGQAAPSEQTMLELFLDPSRYQGRPVRFKGMILRDEQLRPYFGDRNTAVFRFLINCCAADALPLAIAVDADQAASYDNDQWVQVEGVFEVRQIDGNPVPLVETAVITPVPPPGMPYLFYLGESFSP